MTDTTQLVSSKKHPYLIALPLLGLMTLLLMVALYFGQQFALDASSDTLVDQNDPALKYYQQTSERFGGSGDEFLILTYQPHVGNIFEPDQLARLETLQASLNNIPGVKGSYSILDAPLLKSPPQSLAQLENGINTLNSPGTDFMAAQDELVNSPIFSDLLISPDGATTAIRIDLRTDKSLLNARKRRDRLRIENTAGKTSNLTLEMAETSHRKARENFLAERKHTLNQVSDIQALYAGEAEIHLGGVPSIANDIIDYVERDLILFSSSILVLVMFMLYLFFRKIRFVLIPVVASAFSILITIGALGFLHQNATIVSSNFVSILVITTISFSIHLIVKYRELRMLHRGATQTQLVLSTAKAKLAPCIYTALSTIAAFVSLLTIGILPVRDFGWIICIGIIISFFAAYISFIAFSLLLPKGKDSTTLGQRSILTEAMCKIATVYAKHIILSAVLIAVVAAFGITRLSLDNSFINYFKEDTSVHQGLKFIDTQLGGTVPFDIILKFPAYESNDADDEFDDFADETPDPYPERYWFTTDKIRLVNALHDYIDALPRTGKVLSLASLERVAREFNDGKRLGGIQIAGALGALPASMRAEMVDPYAAPSSGELRISVRVKEYGETFSRDDMLKNIIDHAVNELGVAPENIQATGVMVMFNNMLKELFNSQKSSIGSVIGLTFIMFLVLLRSPWLAIIGLVPNILAAALILAIMGYANIPLDLMTITIAALVIGIGVDDAIHYLHRFKLEFSRTQNVIESVQRTHASTGRALYFTSFTVVAGFSVLAFSNFVPTVQFGLLTSLAMVLALVANLALLPALLVCFHRDGIPAPAEGVYP